MSYKSSAYSASVGDLTVETSGTIIPNGESWLIRRFKGSASYIPDTESCLIWDRGGAGELVLYCTHGDADVEIDFTLVGDGVKELEIVLDNQTDTAQSMSASWEGTSL